MPCLPTLKKTASGAALVIVLSLLVLLSAMLVLFLRSSGAMREETHLISEQERSRQLAHLAIDRVTDSLMQATSGVDSAGLANEAWVSQPGMIRTYSQNGSLAKAYKLYSASEQSVTSESALVTSVNSDAPADWASRPREYVDLNSPSGGGAYPILDPGAATQAEGISLPSGVAMPVKWWYLRKDGTFSPDATGDVVGRVAWWTDDETAKLNVNTASEGSYYSANFTEREMSDLPAGGSSAPYAPTSHEYQMMPGHPAATSLSPAFHAGLFPSGTSETAISEWFVNSSPHLTWGGTKGMTLPSMIRYNTLFPTGFVPSVMSSTPFYSSVDDYLEKNRTHGLSLSANTAQQLADRSRFLVTTRSSGNNLNPFGQPRITLWPLPESSAHRTSFDEKIRLASTYAGKPYFFTRTYPTAYMGSNGGATSSQTQDFASIARNGRLYSFLETGTTGSRRVPGISSSMQSFGNKYGNNDWSYTLTGIFDFIRTTNLVDASRVGVSGSKATAPFHNLPNLSYVNNIEATDNYTNKAETSGLVVPIRSSKAFGFGRFPVISEVGIHLFKVEETATDIVLGVAFYFETATPVIGYPAMYPLAGISVTGSPSININITEGGTSLQTGSANFTGANVSNYISPTTASGWKHMLRTGGHHGMAVPLSPREAFHRNVSDPLAEPNHTLGKNYPFYREITFDKNLWSRNPKPVLEMSAFTLNVTLNIGSTTFTPRYTFNFPANQNLPLPDGPARSFAHRLTQIPSATTPTLNYQPSPELILPLDIVRSVEMRDGDLRILAYSNNLKPELYEPHIRYSGSDYQAHNLRPKAWRQYAFSSSEAVQGTWINGLSLPAPALVHTSIPNLYNVGAHYDLPSSFASGFPVNTWARDIVTAPLQGTRTDETGIIQDGPWIIKSQEISAESALKSPYERSVVTEFFTPYLQVPSPVMLGTLPTGVYTSLNAATRAESKPFQTLLFAPNPLGPTSGTHPGLATPRDHFLLNFFQMPVVDPYLLTAPGSSFGQVNLNQQIIPFTHITRTTALHGLLKGMSMHAIPDSVYIGAFGTETYKTSDLATNSRLPIHREYTIQKLSERYSEGDGLNVYRYPSEICDLFLIPKIPSGSSGFTQPTPSNIETWWQGYRMTGDNLRELPYNYLYPRVTTQSNTYRVHIIAQSLSPAFQRNPEKDPARYVTSEWRGSMRLERFLDEEKVDEALAASFDPDLKALTPFFSIKVSDVEVFR